MSEPIKKKPDTREILLNVAEELFSEHGYDGVSVRDITEQAGTRLASINYYFGAKENLYVDVILRRAHVLSTDRLELLDKIDFTQLDTREGLIQLTQAFVIPLLRRSTEGDPGWKNYCRLIAQVATLRHSTPTFIVEEFNPPALKFIEAIKQVLPGLGDRKAHYAFQFMLASTLYIFTENSRLDGMSGGKYLSSDLNSVCQELIKYIVGGLLALADQD